MAEDSSQTHEPTDKDLGEVERGIEALNDILNAMDLPTVHDLIVNNMDELEALLQFAKDKLISP